MKLESLIAVAGALAEASVRYLIVGGVAVNAHGYQRLTNDLDLVLEMESTNIRNALAALSALGYRSMLPVAMEDFADPVVRGRWVDERNLQVFSLTSDRFPETTVDIFATAPFAFDEEYEHALSEEIDPGVEMRFVRLSTLMQMKAATGRPRDQDDVQHLRWIQEERADDEA